MKNARPMISRVPLATARSLAFAAVAGLLVAVSGCDDGGSPLPIAPGPDDSRGLLVLNSTGQTLASFEVSDTLETAGSPVDLGAGFDGSAVDATETHAVTTVSAFGGSRVLFLDLAAGGVTTVTFPDPEGESANPSRARFDAAGAAWFAGRGSDAVYTAMPGETEATRVTQEVGTFVEVVVPAGDELLAVDAFLDDDGGTFAPLGPSRVFVIDAIGALVETIELPDGARNAIDAVLVDGRLVVLLGGTLDATFAPVGDGGIVVVDVDDRTAGAFIPVAANGVAIEAGADGRVYLTTTNDFVSTSVLSFDPATGAFLAGPSDPVDTRDGGGDPVQCWTATALEDGRLLCVTFATAEAGRLLLLEADGSAIDEIPSGFGSTDLLLR